MIYFVLSPSYHGATLLSLLLNNHSDILSLGDTNPTRSFDQTCSCGETVSACEFWSFIRERTGWRETDDTPNLLPQYPYLSRSKTLNHGLGTALALTANTIGRTAWNIAGKPADRFQGAYRSFLDACQTWAPHRVFVDGEKSLLKFMSAASMGFNVKGVIHLTRDPRGFLCSAHKYLPDMTSEQLVDAWAVQHRRIRRYVRRFEGIPCLTLRYEDLAANTDDCMEGIFDFMGLPHQSVVKRPDDPRKHHLIGNNTLQKFDGEVRLDQRWQTTLSTPDQKLAVRQAGNMFESFGYRV